MAIQSDWFNYLMQMKDLSERRIRKEISREQYLEMKSNLTSIYNESIEMEYEESMRRYLELVD